MIRQWQLPRFQGMLRRLKSLGSGEKKLQCVFGGRPVSRRTVLYYLYNQQPKSVGKGDVNRILGLDSALFTRFKYK